jgi:hypothetical protein
MTAPSAHKGFGQHALRVGRRGMAALQVPSVDDQVADSAPEGALEHFWAEGGLK